MNKIRVSTLCALGLLSSVAIGQVPVAPHPQKAAPTAPPTKATVHMSLPHSNLQPALPKKPPVFTAVTAKPRLPGGTQRKIIFVGGKGASSDDSSLNPQPIPPGRPPIDPIH